MLLKIFFAHNCILLKPQTNLHVCLLSFHEQQFDLASSDSEITRLHQMGLIERWIKEYLPPKDRCSKQTSVIEVVNHTVNLDDMQG